MLTCSALLSLIDEIPIKELYDRLETCYSDVAAALGLKNSLSPILRHLEEKVDWRATPSATDAKRLFNQINSAYAYKFCYQHTDLSLSDLCRILPEILLFHQGKYIGLREKDIGFGVRSHLDIFDPRRRTKWIRGVPPQHIASAIDALSRAADEIPKTITSALLISTCLLSIHPYTDGNGRGSRLLFHWLCLRWGLPAAYLKQGEDGEFLMTGDGIESTSYKLAKAVLEWTGPMAEIQPGTSFYEIKLSDDAIFDFLMNRISIHSSDQFSLDFEHNSELIRHYIEEGHITDSPPFTLSLSQMLN